jgi:Type III restriction enzyme, res subunit
VSNIIPKYKILLDISKVLPVYFSKRAIKMIRTTIYHLSALPGVGKTFIMVEKMRNHLLNKGKGIIFYVAPTTDLLDQVRGDLEANSSPSMCENIHKVTSSLSRPNNKLSNISITLRCMLLGNPLPSGTKVPRLKSGSIVLLTHAGFLTLPESLPRKTEITVIFDETRKFTEELPSVYISNEKEKTLLTSLVTSKGETIKTDEGEDTDFKKLTLKEWPKNLKAMTETSNSRKQYSVLWGIVKAAMNPRIELYIKIENEDKKDKKTKYCFYAVTQPSKIFLGYENVILIAAFLKDSQMWHLLKKEEKEKTDIRLLSLWKHPDYTYLKKTFTEKTRDMRDRFYKICLFPLNEQNTPLSMTRLDTGIMVPRDRVKEIKRKLEKLKCNSTGKLLDLLSRKGSVSATSYEKKALKLLKKNISIPDPFSWYVREANRFVDVLRSERKIEGDVLAVVNDKNIKTLSKKYPKLHRIPTANNGINSFQQNNTLVFMAALNPKPALTNLYSAILPKYNFTLDHLAESCAQAVTRLNIRDITSDMVTYVILPDTAMAELLRLKLLKRPLVSNRALAKITTVALTTLNPARKKPLLTPIEGAKAVKDAHRKWRENNQELIRLRNRKNYCLSKLKGGPSVKYETKLQKIEEALKTLLVRAKMKNCK